MQSKIDLTQIKDPSFLKKMNYKELIDLSRDIRHFLIENVSQTGGHLSSNLGVVELTIGMHYVFNSPKDRLLFDVGHQCYTHKILTGRAKEFSSLRKYDGLSGFIKYDESIHDVWESGHSSTTISAQCGMLLSQSVNSSDKVVALIGDASISNGVSFEALNYMGALKNVCPIIILNDNKMAISRSVGAASRSFSKLRSSKAYQKMNNGFARITPSPLRTFFHRIKTSIKGLILKENLFEDLGYDYMGPFDGNDIKVVIRTLKAVKRINKPCVIHFVTTKGKGYTPAELDQNGTYHGVGKFNVDTGEIISSQSEGMLSYSKIMANKIEQMITKDPYYVITPAMLKGCELSDLQIHYPDNVIDVGMAEEHATVMASSMARNGKNVVLLLYSTFAQRAYDYILNDIARTNTHVIIGIDRADIVPGDGETHQGLYDITMFNSMPNVQIVMPRNGNELYSLMDYAHNISSPIVIRYAKSYSKVEGRIEQITEPSWEVVQGGNDLIIITYGENVDYVLDAIKDLKLSIMVINARFIKPIDKNLLFRVCSQNIPVLVYENCVNIGGLLSNICQYCFEMHLNSINITAMGFEPNDIIPCGDVESLRKKFNLDQESIKNKIKEILKK